MMAIFILRLLGAMRGERARMVHMTWLGMCGNEWLIGPIEPIIGTVLHGIHRGRHQEIRPSCAAVGGAIMRATCARPSATGAPAARGDIIGFQCAKTL